MKIFTFCVFIGLASVLFSQSVKNTSLSSYVPLFSVSNDYDSTYLTDLEVLYHQELPDSIRLAVGNDLAYYTHTRNLNKSYSLAYQILSFAKSKKNARWIGRTQITLGAILLRQEKLDSALIVLNAAKTNLLVNEWPMLLTQLGYVYERKGKLSQAADYALEGLRLGDSLNDLKTQALAYSDLSNLFWKQSKYAKGIEYGLQAESRFRQRGIEDMDFSFTLYVIGNNYLAIKDYPLAQKYLKQALIQSERYQFYNNLADIYIALNELYTITGDYNKAEINARQAIKYSSLLENNFMLMRSWLSLAELQNLINLPDSAIASVKTCLSAATDKFGDKYFLNRAYKTLSKAYATIGDYKNAYAAFQKYDVLKDSIFTSEADQRVARLQTEFDVAQKESTIKSQQKSISQRSRLEELTLGIAGLLAIILVGLYRNYQNKRKVNLTLESLNEDLEHKNIQLDKRNAENELLLKEIHHRVKNNLEIVSGLLELQAAQIDHPTALAVMQASQNRVLSMGIIHQKLYQRGNLSAIEMKDYFQHLGNSIRDTFAGDRIHILYDMQPLELDVDTAVPIGLIANELLTNALKYAFPNHREGEVRISLRRTNIKSEYEFSVSDNGIGNIENGNSKGTGFGTELVHLLVQQLDGKLNANDDHGTMVRIVFKSAKSHGSLM